MSLIDLIGILLVVSGAYAMTDRICTCYEAFSH